MQPATAVRVAGFALGKARAGLDGRADLVARARTERRLRVWAALLTATLAATVLVLLAANSADAVATLPSGFQEEVALSGLTNPTNVEFSQDGRVFVAEKSGLIKVFDTVSDTTPTTFADLRTKVHNFWDRGLLGLALAPNFPADPHVYVLYAHDAAIGGTAPRWGTPGVSSDPCPTPPGPTADGCVVSGRLSKLTASGNTMTGSEQVLIEDWCQQYPSHSVGDLAFGADGALYVSGGDGASFNFADYGQDGAPLNPCGDPPGGVGATLTPPTAEGGRCEARTCAPVATRSASTGRSCAWTPRQAPPWRATPSSATPTPTPGASSPRGFATRSASPSGPARARCGWETSAGARGRR